MPYGRQAIDDDDISAVIECLRSDWLTSGPKVTEFEDALARQCGARHAIAVANGTAALHVAMLAGGVGPGDRVITSANTFAASANCAAFVGATPDFADIDEDTLNVSPASLRDAWQKDVKAVVAVDFAGYPCHMPRIAELARERGAIVVEDAAHAVGTQFMYKGSWYTTGGHPWADMTCLSFHPVKTITTGEGGAILSNDDRLAERCRLFRSHGITKDSSQFLSSEFCPLTSEKGPWYYEMQMLGYNYRITDIQCALGISQLRKLQRFMDRRQEIVNLYNAAFADLPHLRLPPQAEQVIDELGPTRPSWHLYVLQIDFQGIGKSRTQIMRSLHERGVGTQVHYIPVHLHPYYRRQYGYRPGKCPTAEAYYAKCLSLPLFPSLTDKDVQCVIAAVRELATT